MKDARFRLDDPRIGGTYGERLWAIKTEDAAVFAEAAVVSREQLGETAFAFERDDYRKRLATAFGDGWGSLSEYLHAWVLAKRAAGFSDAAIVDAMLDAFAAEVDANDD